LDHDGFETTDRNDTRFQSLESSEPVDLWPDIGCAFGGWPIAVERQSNGNDGLKL
jgi:hypothetical protein